MNRFACLLSTFLLVTFGLSAVVTQPLSPVPAVPTRPSYRLSHIRKLIEQENWKEVIRQFRGSLKNGEINDTHIEKLAKHYYKTKLGAAYIGAKNLVALGPSAALSFTTAFPIALFAEVSAEKQAENGTAYWPEALFDRELQYDTEQKRLFIHLGTKGVAPIGEGHYKTVTRTVLYDRLKPQVMARAVTTTPLEREMKMMRQLIGSPGVIQAEGLMIHKDPRTHKKQYTVVTKLYNAGSLQNVYDKRQQKRLSFNNRLTIAHNIMTGIAAMHEKGLVHRDLGARNYFVNITCEKKTGYTVKAVVADMGRAKPITEADGGPAQGNGIYMPPEGFFPRKMKGIDYFASDIFAIGCVFWELHFGHQNPWGQHRYYRRESKGMKKNCEDHLYSMKQAREHELAKLEHSKKLTKQQKFVSIILQMTDPDPKKRGNADEIRDMLGRLVKPVKG